MYHQVFALSPGVKQSKALTTTFCFGAPPHKKKA